MADYSVLGIHKIARQAAADLGIIRCPRDGAVMRVVASRAEHTSRNGTILREFDRLPRGAEWLIVDLDLECPACRRRAAGVRPAGDVECPYQWGLFEGRRHSDPGSKRKLEAGSA
ncbi:MAG: hypothetical protein JSW43_01075 [Gemmatimonadota bacterium]|nr:MAG: hypothetical protein JSW43_01075 [Gemmatimonadota bacterium]